MKSKIIALDFDGVVVTNCWPEVGVLLQHNIDAVKKEIANGTKVILWTCRSGPALDEAVIVCKNVGIKLSAVNENLPETLAEYPRDSRKILADEYWDDRAVLKNDSINTIDIIDTFSGKIVAKYTIKE